MPAATRKLQKPARLRLVAELLPPLKHGQIIRPVLCVGVNNTDAEESFPGATIFESIDDGTTYAQHSVALDDAVTGVVNGTMGGGVTGRFWDMETSVQVVLDSNRHQLESVPDEEVASGRANQMLIGTEVVGFATATLDSERTYTLTRLLRGRRNTESQIGIHATNEHIMLLTGGGVQFVDHDLSSHGSTRLYKALPPGAELTDVEDVTRLWYSTASMIAWSPTARSFFRQSGDDIVIKWYRRDRDPFRLLSGVYAPLSEKTERYEVDIWSDDTRTTLKRTLEVSDASEVTYTVAQQTTDFGGAQATIYITIYQMSDVLGRGRGEEAEG